jgi:HSP20 family protein
MAALKPVKERKLKMNTLAKWDSGKWHPFREMEELSSRLSNIMDRAFGRVAVQPSGREEETMTLSQWCPLVDIVEDDKEYLIKAELPEVKKDGLSVTVDNGVLTITGERKFEKEEKGKRYHRIERAYGSFVRSFTVPEDANAAKVNAEFKDGVLLVHLAKEEKAKPRTIEVKVA